MNNAFVVARREETLGTFATVGVIRKAAQLETHLWLMATGTTNGDLFKRRNTEKFTYHKNQNLT